MSASVDCVTGRPNGTVLFDRGEVVIGTQRNKS